MMRIVVSALVMLLAASSVSHAQDMSGESLKSLLAGGLTLTLGGPGEGYNGNLRLEPDGTGTGLAKLDNGKKLDITGSWTIEEDKFCRKWKFNDFKKMRNMAENR